MKFSICTPVVYTRDDPDNLRQPRYELFLRCAASVFSQTFRDFEWVIVDDWCQPSVEEVLKDLPLHAKGMDIKVFKLPQKLGRIAARNEAMKHASGDWICWLDADDEYASTYLQALDKASQIWPDYKIFTMNHLIFNYDYRVNIRQFLDFEKLGGQPFGSGTIGAGAFAFKREVRDAIDLIPEKGLWQLAYDTMEEFPELKPFFWDEGKQGYNSLGNPWGEDFYYFYKMYKQFPAKYLDTALYFVHSHYGHRFQEDPDYAYGEEKGVSWNTQIR